MQVTKTFSDKGLSNKLLLRNGESFTYTVDLSVDFDGLLYLKRTSDGGATNQTVATVSSDQLTAITVYHEGQKAEYYFEVHYGVGLTSLTGTADITLTQVISEETLVGTVAAPASGTIDCVIEKTGPMFKLVFTLTAARISVTDGAASGSYGSLKIFDFVQAALSFLGTRQDYTAYSAASALTTGAGDAAFVIGVGTTAIAAAADAVLAAAEQNVGASISQTLSAGTTTGTASTHPTVALDGTSTAKDLYLNFSGSAATVDASSTIDVTGTIEVVGILLGDD
jgi:hypothetical protein